MIRDGVGKKIEDSSYPSLDQVEAPQFAKDWYALTRSLGKLRALYTYILKITEVESI